jgi:hypothetical protein
MKTLKEICGKCGSKELIHGTLESLFQRSHEFNISPYMEVDNVPPHMKRFYPQLELSTPVVGCKNCGYCWEDKPKHSFSPDDPELKNGYQEGL